MIKGISIDEIKQSLHQIDLICRPYVLMVNPSDKERIEQAIKGTEVADRVELREVIFVEEGKALIMKREDLESWGRPWAGNIFGYTQSWKEEVDE